MAEVQSGSNKESLPHILFVDDEKQVLDSLKRVFRKLPYEVQCANSGQEGLDQIAESTFDVIISDMRMPGMSGADFLMAVAETNPTVKRILLTGYSDNESTIKAINKGKIDAYLEKPVDISVLTSQIDLLLAEKNKSDRLLLVAKSVNINNKKLQSQLSSLEEDNLLAHQEIEKVTTFLDLEKEDSHEALKDNFSTIIKILSLIIDKRMGKSGVQHVVNDVVAFAKYMNLKSDLCEELKNAALLKDLGKMYFSDELLLLPFTELSDHQKKQYAMHPKNAEEVLMPLKGVSYLSKIILHQNDWFDGSSHNQGLVGEGIPLPSRVLKVVADFYELRALDANNNDEALYLTLSKTSGSQYDPKIVEAFLNYRQTINHDGEDSIVVSTHELTEGMVSTKDVLTSSGMLLLAKGIVLDDTIIEKLIAYEKSKQSRVFLNVKVLH